MRPKQTRPKQRVEQREQALRNKVLRANDLKEQIASSNQQLRDAGVDFDPILLATMAAVEHVFDILVANGDAERIDLNIGRFEKTLGHLKKLEEKHLNPEPVEA